MFVAPTGATAEECSPWPGEFSPLPKVGSRDPFAAQWASLRVRELGRLAALLETQDLVEAHRVWRHLLCLEPESELARAALERTRPPVMRPQLASLEPPAPPSAPPRPAVARVAPPKPATRPPTPPAPPEPDFAELDRSIEKAEALVFAARFDEALDSIRRLGDELRVLESSPEVGARKARLAVLTATTQLAFGDEAGAQASFARALGHDPELRLDSPSVSPKVRRAFDTARLGQAGQRTVAAPIASAPLPDVSAAPPPAPAPDFSELDGAIEEAESLVFAARFDDALESVEGLRAQMAELLASPDARDREARLEVITATAQLAFGDEDGAQASFARALEADPGFRLDEASVSPKLRRAYDAARLAAGSAR